MRFSSLLVLLTLSMAPARPAIAADPIAYQVIVHSTNPTTTLTKRQASRLFQKKTKTWDHGPKVVPVDQKRSSRTRRSFSTHVMGKSVSAMKSYWQQQIFSGRGVPTKNKSNDAAVVVYVSSNPGAIGYVSIDADVGKARVVAITD